MSLRKNGVIRKSLSPAQVELLGHAQEAVTQILPHLAIPKWEEHDEPCQAGAVFGDATRRNIRIRIAVGGRSLCASVERLTTKEHVDEGLLTCSEAEKDVCDRIARQVSEALAHEHTPDTLQALQAAFNDTLIAKHVSEHKRAAEDGLPVQVLPRLFTMMRNLGWRTYENKSLAFGCIVEEGEVAPEDDCRFPDDYFNRKKRYYALSDGLRSAYRINAKGKLISFEPLDPASADGKHWHPEWAGGLAKASRGAICGVALTRQGELLIFQDGMLRFSFRFGRWQYWQHVHIIRSIKSLCRVQKVEKSVVGKVVANVYRAALNVSFRRSGGLFVILKKQANIHEVARPSDQVGNGARDGCDVQFDAAIGSLNVTNIPTTVLVELASLDGAVVITSTGSIVAYGAILQPRRQGKLTGTEGSRTKVAIGASHYGTVLKVSADGEMTVYYEGEEYLRF